MCSLSVNAECRKVFYLHPEARQKNSKWYDPRKRVLSGLRRRGEAQSGFTPNNKHSSDPDWCVTVRWDNGEL